MDKNKINMNRAMINFFNFVCFIAGMVMVWYFTHSFYALFWTFVASLHFSYKEQNI